MKAPPSKAPPWADEEIGADFVAPMSWFGSPVHETAPTTPTYLPPAPEHDDLVVAVVPEFPVVGEYVVYSEQTTPPGMQVHPSKRYFPKNS